MFSTLTQNSVLYVWDLNNSPKVLQGTIERVSIPRPRYKTFNPTLETIVDITAVINGEKREFKDVPNNAVADFGENSFVIAESKDALNAYINSRYQNAKGMIENAKREEARLPIYEESLEELNPTIKYEKEKDKVIASLQYQIKELKDMVTVLVKGEDSKK